MPSELGAALRTLAARLGGSPEVLDRMERLVRDLVRAETSRAIRAMGLATREEVERLAAQVADLKRAVADATTSSAAATRAPRSPTARARTEAPRRTAGERTHTERTGAEGAGAEGAGDGRTDAKGDGAAGPTGSRPRRRPSAPRSGAGA